MCQKFWGYVHMSCCRYYQQLINKRNYYTNRAKILQCYGFPDTDIGLSVEKTKVWMEVSEQRAERQLGHISLRNVLEHVRYSVKL